MELGVVDGRVVPSAFMMEIAVCVYDNPTIS